MNRYQDFNALIEQAMQQTGHAHMRPVITKELLHYDILFALDRDHLLEKLCFQGGTCLRLCYGAARFSEDLDFAGGRDFVSQDMIGIKNCIEKYIGQRYGLAITIKEPKDLNNTRESKSVNVAKWQIKITTSPERKDLPKQTIKIEVANIAAYSRTPRSLQANYEFLPDGYGDMFIMTESLDEIMADKLIAFVASTRYIRYRDIWDLRWLRQQGAKMHDTYILAKIKDYTVADYPQKLAQRIDQLNDIIYSKAFTDEMSRFIPMNIQERTFRKPHFLELLLNETNDALQQVQALIQK